LCHAGRILCAPDCSLRTAECPGGFCGDGIRNGDEPCDGDDVPACAAGHGVLTCTPDCTLDLSACDAFCGDGTANAGEPCDGDDVPTCHSGRAACAGDCTLALGECPSGFCGDGVRNGPEDCDGADVPLACAAGAGEIRCTADCTFDPTGCSAYCGDGLRNGIEVCDGAWPPTRSSVGDARCCRGSRTARSAGLR
jgi:hypothetical protein